MKFRAIDYIHQRILSRRPERIERSGCIYYAQRDYPRLNLAGDVPGVGMHVVMPASPNSGPIGIFFTKEIGITELEVDEAMLLYGEIAPGHAEEACIVPAAFFNSMYEHTSANHCALRKAGAFWVREIADA